jgi:uncharacterized integral membrane protein (TIGR00698 family)
MDDCVRHGHPGAVAAGRPCELGRGNEVTLSNPVLAEWHKIRREIGPALPGLHLVVAVAVVARYLHSLIPNAMLARAISEVFIAVFLGLYIRNVVRFSARFEPGVKFALQRILRWGIILLGLRLSLQDVVATGLEALLLIGACMTLALTLAYLGGRFLRIPSRLATLIGVGTAICGNTAIVATAPVIEAKDEDVSIAVATITFFGTLAVLLYPIIGYFAGLSDHVFGLWVGTAVNDTSQVVAAGAAFSEVARDVATVVKLTRNTLMVPIIIVIGIVYARSQNRRTPGAATKFSFSKVVPWFVIGFLLMTLVRTVGVALGVLPQDVNHPGQLQGAANVLIFVDEIAKFFILMALSAIGLSTDAAAVRRTGIRPFALGVGVASILAVFSLGLILLTGLGR